ncbi:MAG TPA: hypothetical protein VMX13_14930 [Sedimentisphaerales bacterium]|nr:hypothetical protein [Sedimentisphaerales bacterium]
MLRNGRLILLLAAASWPVGWAASAETWHLEDGQAWQQISVEAKQAYDKANDYLRKGKKIKAARSFDAFLKECEPTSELYAAALEKQFSIGKEYLGGRRRRVLLLFKIKGYATGVKMMERISERASSGAVKAGAAAEGAASGEESERLRNMEAYLKKLSARAAVEVALHYEARGRSDADYYELAHQKWLEILESYDNQLKVSSSQPTGEIGKDALLGMGRCKMVLYGGPAYDSTVLRGQPFTEEGVYGGAEGCYREFISRYPQEASRFGLDEELKKIEEELAGKDLFTGRYYQKVGNKQAANLYYQMVVRDWQGTAAAGTAQELLAANMESEK